MLIEHNREKLLNAIIYFLTNTKYCGKTKLFKLFYYLDFMHFRETGRSVTGLDYYAWQFGPYPIELANDINTSPDDLKETVSVQCSQNDNNNFTCMKPRKYFDDTFFQERTQAA